MSIDIEMTGSGTIGPLAPGWTVQEYATPVVIGNTAGGTGNISFNASAKEDSLFVVNNDITTTEKNLGSISGVVKSVSQTGLNVSINHNTQLAIFDATKNIPALGAGGVYPALDLCNQLSSRQILLTLPTGRFYSMGGHSAGFDTLGSIVETETSDGSYTAYDSGTGTYYPIYFREQYGSIWADTFDIVDNELYATHIYGDCFSNNKGIRTSRMAFKTKLNGGLVSWGFEAGPYDSNLQTGKTINLTLNEATGKMTLFGDYQNGSTTVNFLQEYNLATTIDITGDIAVFIEYTRPIDTGVHTITVTACNTADYTDLAVMTQTLTAPASSYNLPWSMTGNVRAIYRDQGLNLGSWIQEYELPETYEVLGALTTNGPVASQPNTNMWEYLQQACSAYGYEIALVDDIITARELGLNFIDIDNKTVPTISPNMTLKGRSVEVVYSNALSITNQELYNAREDNNRVLSVKAAETITTTVPISGTPTVINLPARSPSTTGIINVGEYAICDNVGVQIPQRLWAKWGGRVDVYVSETVLNAIDITLTGPSSTDGTFNGTTPTYPGPYKIAYSASGSDYAALSITGAGVKTTPATLKVNTAADHSKVSQDVAKTITNAFIATKDQAYDRGLWAVNEASGPSVSLSCSIPISAIDSFGLAAGSLIRYNNSIYRVDDASIGNLAVNINATRYVVVEDFDNVWLGKSVNNHDLFWEGYDTSDEVIAPLRYSNVIRIILDDDGVTPYSSFKVGYDNVYLDDDGVPYFKPEEGAVGARLIYLDDDATVYYV